MFDRIRRALTFIRFSHTIFALPFALGAMLVAAGGLPGWRTFGLILLAMVFARTAAMTFNRIADWEFDQANPRTASRHLLISRPAAIGLLVVTSAAFVAVTWFINPLCFRLSPVALVIVFVYSVTKRFTDFTQLYLGLALAVSPVGAWLAVTGHFAMPPLILAAGVLCWVAGFDLIYATMDHEFDQRTGLRSMVVRFGVPRSLRLATWLHGAMFALLIVFGIAAHLGVVYFASLAFVLAALVYEHRSASRLDLAAINDAFFKSNAIVGLVFVGAILIDRAG